MTSPKGESPTGTNKTPSDPSDFPKTILVLFGTRPEAIKLCPLIAELRKLPQAEFRVVVCATAQHRGMLDQVLATFGVAPDYDLDLMRPGQSLNELTSRLLAALEPVFAQAKPDLLVVQGDTTTTLCGSLSAFYGGVPAAHVEAGLRTYDFAAPFPEEMNRVFTTQLAALHFAPTEWAAGNLRRAGIPATQIEVTGNTGIDAVLAIADALLQGRLPGWCVPVDERRKLVVVTAHRRENFGERFREICEAVLELAKRDDIQIVWPVHPNPNVREALGSSLNGLSNIIQTEPLDYVQFVDLMRRSYLLITDSGGVQEEGPSFGKPILVLREKTERPEAVEAGTVKLVGSKRERIVAEATVLLDDAEAYRKMAQVQNPYGDGRASGRITARIRAFLSGSAVGKGL